MIETFETTTDQRGPLSKLDFSEPEHHVRAFGRAECHFDVFDQDELRWLGDYMFRNTASWRTSDTGNLFFSGNLLGVMKRFRAKIEKHLNLEPVTTVKGNYFHTPHQYGFHTDMPEETDRTFAPGDYAYKSLLIPLYHLPARAECHIMFFNERLLHYGTTLDKGPTKSLTHYNSYDDYSSLDFIYDLEGRRSSYREFPFSQEIFDRFEMGATSPIYRYHGFTIESVFDWKPGSLIVFDTAQLHASNRGSAGRHFRVKAGLRLSLWANYRDAVPKIRWDDV